MLEICTNSPPDRQRFTCNFHFDLPNLPSKSCLKLFPSPQNISRNLRCLIDDLIATIITIARLTLGVPYKTSRKVFSVHGVSRRSMVPNSRRASKTQCEGLVGQCRAQAFLEVKQNKFSNSQNLSWCLVFLCVSSCDKADKGP